MQYISNDQGELTGVILPIAVWKEMVSELETHHLLKSKTMKKRLLEAKGRNEGIAFEEVLDRLCDSAARLPAHPEHAHQDVCFGHSLQTALAAMTC